MVTRYLVCLVFFGLFGCSPETVIMNTAESVNKPTLDNSIPLVESSNESPIKVIGDFTNVKDDGEHAYGYSVELWTQEDKIYGLISGSDALRLSGDPPTGILENVKFDPKTKRLSFRAKLSTGVFEFEGVLTNKKLAGKLSITNELCSDKCPQTKAITLRLSKEWTSLMSEYQSYAEWEAYANEILKFRGPKR